MSITSSMLLGNRPEMLRTSRYFRLSLTSECNLACYFCHNEGQRRVGEGPVWLDATDLTWVCGLAHDLGFQKFKLTGGEPTLRRDLLDIISGIRGTGIEDLSMITNGVTLKRLAPDLRRAGLSRINVSLYTLDEKRFVRDNGGSARTLGMIVEGIDAAIATGYTDMKLNYVWHQSRDLTDFLQVAGFAAERKLTVAVLPLLSAYGTRPEDEFSALSDVYQAFKGFGIRQERVTQDAEGVRRRLLQLEGGATVLLRMEELGRLGPYTACQQCPKRPECREGIFPVRLSANGALRACLAEGRAPVPLLAAIKRRDRIRTEEALRAVHDAFVPLIKAAYAGVA